MSIFKQSDIIKIGKKFKKESKNITKYINKNIGFSSRFTYSSKMDDNCKLIIYNEDNREYATFDYKYSTKEFNTMYLNEYAKEKLEDITNEVSVFLDKIYNYSLSLKYKNNIILSSKNI